MAALKWVHSYSRSNLVDDFLAALIVTVLVIPQSLAYAMLAGLPPETGLYAGMLPPVLYALLGTSAHLAVGPVAIVSLMTASTIHAQTSATGLGAAEIGILLAAISGLVLCLLGALRLGFLANFLSHPVMVGFVTASAVLIACSQARSVLGISAEGQNLPSLLSSIYQNVGQANGLTFLVGSLSIAFLTSVKQGSTRLFEHWGMSPRHAHISSRVCPLIVIVLSTVLSSQLDWEARGVETVGAVPATIPPLTRPLMDLSAWASLLVPALLISLVGFVEAVSVAKALATRVDQTTNPNQELIALGVANMGAAFTSGYPVSGSFSRSALNFDAGASTPAAGLMTGIGLLVFALFLMPLLHDLPLAVLAATIIVAVLSLIDVSGIRKIWRSSRKDGLVLIITLIATLLQGVEVGLVFGVMASSIASLLRPK